MAKKNYPMLPQISTIIRQPNRVTNAKYDYTLLQQKVLSYIMKELQGHIQFQLANKVSYQQLALFSEDNKVEIKIVLKDIAKHHQDYDTIIDSIRDIRTVEINFPVKDQAGKRFIKYTSLLSDVIVPEDRKHVKEVFVTLEKSVAKELLNIQEGHTKYVYEIISKSTCKYTPKVYTYICRWRDKGGVKILYSEFREMLGIAPDKYKEWKDFKKRVINEVQAELTEKADVWFEVELEKTNQERYLAFKIITSEDLQMLNTKRDAVMELLRHHFYFKENHFKAVAIYLIRPNVYQDLFEKLISLRDYMSQNGANIKDVPAYVIKSIQKDFKHRVK